MNNIKTYLSIRLKNLKTEMRNPKKTTCSLKARLSEIEGIVNIIPDAPGALYVDIGYIEEFLKNRKHYLKVAS